MAIAVDDSRIVVGVGEGGTVLSVGVGVEVPVALGVIDGGIVVGTAVAGGVGVLVLVAPGVIDGGIVVGVILGMKVGVAVG